MECEAWTLAGERCKRPATLLSPLTTAWPKRRLDLCPTHFWMLMRADRQEGPGAAISMIAVWAMKT